MKKSCTLVAVLALGCISMSATVSRSQMASEAIVSAQERIPVCKMMKMSGASSERASAFTTVEEMSGNYTVKYKSLIEGHAGEVTDIWSMTVSDAAKGEVEVKFHPRFGKFKAVVDLSSNTFSIPSKQLVGTDEYGSVYLYFKDPDTNTGALIDGPSDIDALVGTISGNKISFPALSVFALGDYEKEQLGYYFLGYAVEMSLVSDQPNPDEGWSPFGTATFTDGWVSPGYDQLGDDAVWKVNVQRNDDDKNLFRLDNPYAMEGNALAEMADITGGYIVLSIADPDFVKVVDNVYSGVQMMGEKICMTNFEGYMLGQGYSKEYIVESNPSINTWSTYKDKVVDIPHARFTIGDGGLYGWPELINLMKSKIVFDRDPEGDSGVESLEYDADAPVEYFTLQGVRVQNPERGTLVIKRQGSKVCKTVVR